MARKRNRRVQNKKHEICEPQSQKKIELQLDIDHSKYDACNELVLPSETRLKKKTEFKAVSKPQYLSNKKRKKLKKVLERKAKIKDRKLLIEELNKYAITKEENSKLVSVKEQKSKRTKRLLEDPVKSVDGSKKEKYSVKARKREDTSVGSHEKNLNVVGFGKESDNELSESSVTSREDSESNKDIDSEINNEDKEDNELSESSVISGEDSDSKKDIDSEINSEKKKEKSPVAVDKILEKPINEAVTFGSDKTEFVAIHRLEEVQSARLLLPILAEEQTIMEAIRYNQIVIICGETGSGKTTQIPQFLFEAGYAKLLKICVTEPRRVAAISMSKRVAYEMNATDNLVSYQVRYDGNISKETKICFVTDGVLLKEIQKDFLLSSYSVVIIDEAHERSLYSDILIGILSRIIPLRFKRGFPLRLIIMSATLRVEDFTGNSNLFKVEPKVLKVQSRQYSVTVHFSKRTPEDYIQEAYLKVCAIHRKYGDGGILVFVTGQQEVQELCSKLRRTFPCIKNSTLDDKSKPSDTADIKKPTLKNKRVKQSRKVLNDLLPEINLDSYKYVSDEEDEVVTDENVSHSNCEFESVNETCPSLYCLPLYAKLPEYNQSLIFSKPPEGSRMCVIATNIAETSLTIPGIKYVVDTGKVKTKFYDKITGISTMIVTWTSKASADQRAGRAGRISNGHCFRLYSSAVFKENFCQFSSPEICNKPVDELFLQMKSMNIENVFNFPFPTPPSVESLKASEKRLLLLGALEEKRPVQCSVQLSDSKLTQLGKAMSFFSLNPRYSKMLALSVTQGLLVYTIAIVSSLTVQDIFLDCRIDDKAETHTNEMRKKWRTLRKKWADTGNSLLLGDFMVLLKAVGSSEFVKYSARMIEEYGLRMKAMVEIRKLRLQLTANLNRIMAKNGLPMDLHMNPPTDIQAKCLRQLSLAGLLDHVAKKLDIDDVCEEQGETRKNGYKSIETERVVYLSPDCVLIDTQPEFVVYQEIYETSGKLYMRNVVALEKEWLPIYAPNLCTFSKPLESPLPRYDCATDRMVCSVTATFGPHSWLVPVTEIDFPESIEKYRWFARNLLEGHVHPFFEKYNHCLVSSPSIIVKSWAKLQPKTQSILSALYSKKCASKKQFLRTLEEDCSFMLNEYCEWLPEEYCEEVRKIWPASLLEQRA